MSWQDFKQQYQGDSMPETPQPTMDEPIIDTGSTLKKDDLKGYQYLNPIREYMVDRKGVDYKDKNDDEVVNDFVEHMRWFNANTVSTAGELRFISKADEMRKEKARKAYEIYDQLGNVFVNDGMMGAVSGVGDYIFAAAADPTNYIGLITGGVARAGAAGVSVTGKKAVQMAVRKAGMEAAQSGAGRAAAAEAAQKAGIEAAKRAVENGFSSRVAGKTYQEVAKKATLEGRKALAKNAMIDAQKQLFEGASTKALKQTFVLDATAAVAQDVMAQQAMLKAGAQEEYSVLQTGFSSLLGGVGAAAQLGFGKFRGASGLEETGSSLEKVANATIEEFTPKFKAEDTKKIANAIVEAVDDWNTKVERGYAANTAPMPSDLIKTIMLGEDGKGGIAKYYKDYGYTIKRGEKIADVMTNVAQGLPQEDILRINKAMAKYSGVRIGDLSSTAIQIGDFLARDASEAGKVLNVWSQVRASIDSTIVAGQDLINGQLDEINAKDEIADQLNKAELFKYGQNVWKRLLVSSTATTGLNLAGYAQYAVGQTFADLVNMPVLTLKGLGQLTYNREAAKESFRQARVYTTMVAQRARNLLDPYTTHDAYMRFLDDNNDVRKVLFETMAGGVESSAKRHGINPDNPVFKNIESLANAANQITGVRIQDSFTKSQMFMGELDKYLRINKRMTLKEALLSDEKVIDEAALGGALDTTLKSVFAKDYTGKDQGELIRTAAKFTEQFSNTPVIGTILPFGRFFNNVVATAYQWSPLAAPEQFAKFTKRLIKQEGPTVTERDAFARMIVGTTALNLAADYDKERREKGLGVYDMEVGGGTIIDVKNTFPFSAFLAAGRVYGMMRDGETVPPELIQELGTQVAVGQLTKDAQFANDLNNILDTIINQEEGAREIGAKGFAKVTGNFLSGFTRPLDVVNKAFGMIGGTDTAKDVRQAGGMNTLTQSATKYVDNIIEAFIDKTDAITGEDLRVATREGDIYDANPFAKIFGLTIKQGRTAAEKAYSMAEMQPWTANERTAIPAYDKAFNGLIAPMLERQVQNLINTKQFKDASLEGRRRMLKTLMTNTRSEIREMLGEGYGGSENVKLRMAAQANSKANKEVRNEAKKLMKERHGVSGRLEDYTFQELDLFMEYIDLIDETYKEVGKLYGKN